MRAGVVHPCAVHDQARPRRVAESGHGGWNRDRRLGTRKPTSDGLRRGGPHGRGRPYVALGGLPHGGHTAQGAGLRGPFQGALPMERCAGKTGRPHSWARLRECTSTAASPPPNASYTHQRHLVVPSCLKPSCTCARGLQITSTVIICIRACTRPRAVCAGVRSREGGHRHVQGA